MLVTNLIVSSMLCCLIWIIQILHYPSFRFVEQKNFTNFEAFHTKSISYIVMPLMLIELAVSVYLAYTSPDNTLILSSMIIVVLIWLSTFIFSVPCHHHLEKEYNSVVIEKLISTNWPRTIGWTLKLILAVSLIKGVIYE